MIQSIRLLIFSVSVAWLVSSCKQRPEFLGLKNVQMVGLEDSLMKIDMDYVFYNPYKVTTKLNHSNADIYYNNHKVGDGFLESATQLKALDTVRAPVNCRISIAELHRSYPEFLNSDSVQFILKGQSTVGFLVGTLNVKMKDTVVFNTQKIIREQIHKSLQENHLFKLQRVSLNENSSLTHTILDAELEITNNLPFDVKLTDLNVEYKFNSDKKTVGHWQFDGSILQRSKNTVNIPVQVVLDNVNFFQQINLNWLVRKEVDLLLDGIVKVEILNYSFAMPVNDKIRVKLNSVAGFYNGR